MINEESKNNYPTSWEVVKLGDFADSAKGKKPKNQQPLQNEEFHLPYIDIEAFEKGIFKSFTDGEKCVICDDSDFLMVWDGSRSGLVGKGLKGALGSTLVRINLPMINNLYGYYYLQSKYLEINTRAKGVGIPHVDPALLWSYDFPIPPVNEQNRIVDKIETLFSEIDAGIANLTLAKRQLEQYRQSLLKHAFEGKLTAKWREDYAEKHGKSLPNADELLEQIQTARQDYYDQQIADWEQAVEAWEEKGKKEKKPRKPSAMNMKISSTENNSQKYSPLSQIVLSSNLGKMLDKNKNEGEPKEYLGNINVRWSKFDLDNLKEMRITEADYDKCLLKNLDLVICEGGEPARCAVWLESYSDEMYIQKALHRVRLPTDLISPYFLQLYFDYLAMTGLIDAYITGTTIKHLTGTSLAKIPMPILSIDE